MLRSSVKTTKEDVQRYAATKAASLPPVEQQVFVRDLPGDRKLIVVKDSTQIAPDGLCLGGMRWKQYASLDDAQLDAMLLAEGMTRKWSILNHMVTTLQNQGDATLAEVDATRVGGAKAVIYDQHPVPRSLHERMPVLEMVAKHLDDVEGYVTAPDMNTSISDMGIIHHYAPGKVVCRTLESGGSGDPSIVTASGVYNALCATFRHKFGRELDADATVAVQGVGSVGDKLVKRLSKRYPGIHVIMTDIDALTLNMHATYYSTKIDVRTCHPAEVYDQKFDVFAPCAAGQTVSAHNLERMLAANPGGLAIAGGANNQIPKADAKRVAQLMDAQGVSYAPDFVANLGGILNVVYEMPTVMAENKGRYTGLRPLHLVTGVDSLVTSILGQADGRCTQEVAEYLAVDNISRWR